MMLYRLILCVLIVALFRIQQSIAYSRWHAVDKTFNYRCNSFNQKDICRDRRRITIVDSIDSRSYESRRLNRLYMVARIPAIISSSNRNVITSTIRSLSSMINPAVSGGMLSGGLHAITGPDHLAALMGPSIGKPGYYGLRIGALWGLGHGFSALLLGSSAFYLKGQFTGRFAVLEKLANLAESAVGISILFIGLIGIKESYDAEAEEKSAEAGVDSTKSKATPSTSSSSTTPAYPRSSRAIFANGILHGLSWDGAPSLAPAITMTSWKSALTFLLSYSIGTIITMSLAAGAVGELSLRVSKVTNNPDLPRKLSLVTSFMAVAIGVFFTLKSLHIIH